MASHDGGYGVSCLSGDNLILSTTDSQCGPPGHGGGQPTALGPPRTFSRPGMWTLKIPLQEITDHKGQHSQFPQTSVVGTTSIPVLRPTGLIGSAISLRCH